MNKPINANERRAMDEVENAIKALYQHMGKDPNSFEWEQEDTSWTNRSKQISIYCSEGPRKIDSITLVVLDTLFILMKSN